MPTPTPSNDDRRRVLFDLVLWIGNAGRSEPMFRLPDRIPERKREILRQLKSDDIANDNWHLRR